MAYNSTYTGAEVDAAVAKVKARSGDLVDGSGNATKVAKFSGTNTITDSIITDSGSTVTIAGHLDVSDNNITNVGSIALDTITNDGTDVTIDSSGDIILDADGAQVRIKDAGTERFVFNTDATPELDVSGGNFTIHANTSDADIILSGNDGGSTISALTLDMSEAGAATFNSTVAATSYSGALANGVTATTQSADDNSTKVATTAYVDAAVTAEDLDFAGDSGTGAVDLDSQSLTIAGTTNEIETSASGQTITIGLPSSITANVTGDLTGNVSGTDITLDASGDIILDAGGADIRLKDDGTQFGRFANSSSNLVVASSISDKDILFQGSDGGSTITALTLDMSAAGAATFNDKVIATELDISGNIDVDGTTNLDAVDIDGAVDMASTLTVADDANFDSGTLFVDASASKVGVLHTTPDEALQVNGNVRIGDDSTADMLLKGATVPAVSVGGSGEAAIVTTKGSGSGAFHVGVEVPANDANDGFYVATDANTDGTVDTVALKIRADGNVGIKNTSPSSTLDVTGTLAVSGNVDFNGDLDVAGDLTASSDAYFGQSDSGTNAVVSIYGRGTGSEEGGELRLFTAADHDSTYNYYYLDAYEDDMRIGRQGQADIWLKSDGKVGIANSTPSSTLDVTGTLAVSGNVDFNGDLDVDGTSNLDAVDIDGAVDMASTLTVAGDTVLNSDLEINVNGASNGSKAIVINSSGTNFESDDGMIRLLHPSTGSGALTGGYFMKFNANSSDKFTVKGNGNTYVAGRVGIGTTSPSHKLHLSEASTDFAALIANSTSSGNGLKINAGDNAGDRILQLSDKDGNEKLRVGATGLVGIGTTSASYNLDVNGTGRFVNDLTLDEDLVHNRTGAGAFPGYSAGTFGAILEDGGSNGSTLYMSRKNSWALYLATDTTLNAQSDKVVVFSDLNGQSGDADNIVGDITITSSSTAFNTSSDYRLKENEVDITDGIDRLKQLKPYRFNFKRDADTTVDGFFAHEVSDIVPEAITGTKDAMKDQEYEVSPAVYEDIVHPAVEAVYDEDGQQISPAEEEWTESVLVTEAVRDTRSVPDYQGIDQSKLVPLLTAALQEAVAKIESLEARVATLEG